MGAFVFVELMPCVPVPPKEFKPEPALLFGTAVAPLFVSTVTTGPLNADLFVSPLLRSLPTDELAEDPDAGAVAFGVLLLLWPHPAKQHAAASAIALKTSFIFAPFLTDVP